MLIQRSGSSSCVGSVKLQIVVNLGIYNITCSDLFWQPKSEESNAMRAESDVAQDVSTYPRMKKGPLSTWPMINGQTYITF